MAKAPASLLSDLEADGERFPWSHIYTHYLAQSPHSTKATSGYPGGSRSADKHLGPLEVEPFVGPLKISISSERGRGLVLTEAVRAGQLLMCAEAVAVGPTGQGLLQAVAQRMLENASVQDAVMCLSKGTNDSESRLPKQSLAELASPKKMRGERKPVDATVEDLIRILWCNQFALPLVDATVSPLAVSSDTTRSGLWLLPAFVNHACRPNVHKIIVGNLFFLRAVQDLDAGTELLDCYTGQLHLLAQRQEALKGYGFICSCLRCELEAAALDPAKAREAASASEKAAMSPGFDVWMEAVAQAESLVRCSVSVMAGKSRRGKGMPLLLSQLPHDCLCRLLLAGILGEAVCTRGVAAKQKFRDLVASNAAWEMLLSFLVEVQPCSEVGAIVHSAMLLNKVSASGQRSDPSLQRMVWRAQLACHQVYGGGFAVWQLIFGRSLTPWLRDLAETTWAEFSSSLMGRGRRHADRNAMNSPCTANEHSASADLGVEGDVVLLLNELLPVRLIARALGWLPLSELFASACICKKWSQAGFHYEAWERLRLSATKRSLDAENNVLALSEDSLFRLAKRLQDVAQRGPCDDDCPQREEKNTFEVLPARLCEPRFCEHVRDVKASQMELCRYRFGPQELWVLQYNTHDYSWMHDMKTLGLKVWPACRTLCNFLVGVDAAGVSGAPPTLAGRRCLELGAGVGLLGALLSRLGAAAVMVTDQDEACLRVARANVRLNLAGSARVEPLTYGLEAAQNFAQAHGCFDCIFGADLVYSQKVCQPLIETAKALLDPGGTFYLSHASRGEEIDKELLRAAQAAGFSWEEPRRPAEPPKKQGITGMLQALNAQLKTGASLSSAFMASTGTTKVLLYCFTRLAGPCLSEMD